MTIFRDERVYASHASVCQAANGDILVAFRQAPFEHIFAHVHPSATVGLTRSRDGGKTWGLSATVLDPGEETNVNDPSLTTLSNGTIILTAFVLPCPRKRAQWGERALPVRGNDYFYVPDEQRIVVAISSDHGATWGEPWVIEPSCYGGGGAGVFASVAELKDGRLLLPITAKTTDGHRALLIESRDCGNNWRPFAQITSWKDADDRRCFGLPSLVALDERRMVMAGWGIGSSGTLVTRSNDNGLTWSEPIPVDTAGACMHLCRTHNRVLILSYGHRHPPYGIRLLVSDDCGTMWDPRKAAALRSDGAMRDLGYPRTIDLSDGRLFCVYYFNLRDEDKSYYDERESLRLCTEWNLDPELYTYKTAGLRFIAGTFFAEDELRRLAGTTHDAESRGPEPTLI